MIIQKSRSTGDPPVFAVRRDFDRYSDRRSTSAASLAHWLSDRRTFKAGQQIRRHFNAHGSRGSSIATNDEKRAGLRGDLSSGIFCGVRPHPNARVLAEPSADLFSRLHHGLLPGKSRAAVRLRRQIIQVVCTLFKNEFGRRPEVDSVRRDNVASVIRLCRL